MFLKLLSVLHFVHLKTNIRKRFLVAFFALALVACNKEKTADIATTNGLSHFSQSPNIPISQYPNILISQYPNLRPPRRRSSLGGDHFIPTFIPMDNSKPISWRSRLHETIYESNTTAGKAFDVMLLLLIIASIIVVMLDSIKSYQQYEPVFDILEWTFTILFTIEYILRLISIKKPWL